MSRRLAAAVNLMKTWALLIGASALLAGLGWLIGGYRLFSIVFFAGLLAGIALYWYADRAILGIVRSRELVETEAVQLFASADWIAARAHLPRPRLYVIGDGHPRAFGRARRQGPLDRVHDRAGSWLPPSRGLEGLISHEIASVRRDLLTQTVAAVVGSTLLEVSRAGAGFSAGCPRTRPDRIGDRPRVAVAPPRADGGR